MPKLLISGQTKSMERFAKDPELAPYIGHLWTPATGNSLSRQAATGLQWACDNAAFGDQWDTEAFEKAVLAKLAACPVAPMFVPAPDVVGDAVATLVLFEIWLKACLEFAGVRLALVLQDGCEDQLLPWDQFDWVFVGGSRKHPDGRRFMRGDKGPYVEWKESKAAADMIREAKKRGKKVHAGRVNGMKRLRHFYDLNADTYDGSSFSMYADTWVPQFVAAVKQWDAEQAA